MMNEMKIGTYYHNGEFHNFEFRTDLTVADKLKFVNSVVDLIVDDNRYNSVIRDLIFDYYTIKFFTTVDTDKLDKSDAFLNDTEEFILSTNIIDIVKANAFPMLFDELNDAVNKSIQYLTGIHPSPLSDALASLLSAIEKKINEVDLTNMTEMAQKLTGMAGDFTPESIVNAYLSSDMHKKNLAEIAEAKNDSKVE